jgi:hypothetical protein
MSDTITRYYLDDSFGEKEIKTEETYSQDVINIRELFRLLSFEDKIIAKRLIQQEKIF